MYAILPLLHRADSYKDYLPNLSLSDDTDSPTILTEPSTPSTSYCPTPELVNLQSHISRMRSATLSDLPEVEFAPQFNLPATNKSSDDISVLPRHYSFPNPSMGECLL